MATNRPLAVVAAALSTLFWTGCVGGVLPPRPENGADGSIGDGSSDATAASDSAGRADSSGALPDASGQARDGAPPAGDGGALDATMSASDSGSSDACVGSWASARDMTLARAGMATAVVAGEFYVLGGQTGGSTTGSIEVYDPGGDSWTTKTASATARAYASAGAIGTKIYVAGGCVGSDCVSGLTDLLEEYDTQLDSWSTKRPMATTRHTMAGAVIDGKFYLAGGMQACPPCTPDGTLEVYDPSNDSWNTLAPMPSPSSQHTSAAAYNGKLYVFGGDIFSNGSGLPSPDAIDFVQVYDPGTNRWSTASRMPTPRSGAGIDALGGVIFTVSGQTDAGVVSRVEAYDPARDSWCTGVPIPTPRFGAHCNAAGGSLYCVGANATNGALGTVDVFTPAQ